MYMNVPAILGTKQSRITPNELSRIESDLLSIAHFEKEMDYEILNEVLLAIESFCASVMKPDMNTVQRVHPISRKPRLEGYDYIGDLKAITRQHLTIMKELYNVKTSAFYDLWFVPLLEANRYAGSRARTISNVLTQVDQFKNKLINYTPPSDEQSFYNKTKLIELQGKKHIRSLVASKIIEDRLRKK